MIPLLDFLLQVRYIIYISVKKICVGLYMVLSLLGTWSHLNTLNQFLVTNKQTERPFYVKWLSYLMGSSDKAGCDSFVSIYTSPRCIQAVFLRDEEEVDDMGMNLSTSSKWQYLIIMKTILILAPYVFMMSLFLMPFYGFILHANIMKKVFHFLGYDNAWRNIKEIFSRLSTRIGIRLDTLEDLLYIHLGFIAASFIACLYPSTYSEGLDQPCQTPSCLYCYIRLAKTVFQDQDDTYYETLGITSRITFRSMVLISTAVFESLLFVSTIFILCLMVYIAVDGVLCLWRAGRFVKDYLAMQETRDKIRVEWNRCVNIVKNSMPIQGEGDEIR